MPPKASRQKILIAGVGNVLHGDDGFGIELAHRLIADPKLPQLVKVIETGIGGISLIQELMYGYNALIILDAYKNNGTPGRLYMLEPVLSDLSGMDLHQLRDYFSDTHYATPVRALNFLTRINQLPDIIRVIGCEPEETESLRIGLSPPVADAVEGAVQMVISWVNENIDAITTGQYEAVKN